MVPLPGLLRRGDACFCLGMHGARSADVVLRESAAALATAGVAEAMREARILLLHALGRAPAELLDRDAQVTLPGFAALLARRCAREPMARILGRQGFWTLDLEVSAATLIPRGDSETLIEAALAAWPDRMAVRRVLDLGTGTGCLLLAALSEFAAAWGVGIDRSEATLVVARRNAEHNGLAVRAAWLCGDWGSAVGARFDIVLCNPPYIADGEIDRLMPEVALHEPRAALSAGPDGLAAYRTILPALPGLLAPGGVAVLELGAGQAGKVGRLAMEAGFAAPVLRSDLGGIARALVLRRAGG